MPNPEGAIRQYLAAGPATAGVVTGITSFDAHDIRLDDELVSIFRIVGGVTTALDLSEWEITDDAELTYSGATNLSASVLVYTWQAPDDGHLDVPAEEVVDITVPAEEVVELELDLGTLPTHTHAHADLTLVGPNQHHAQSHGHTGADGSGTVDADNLIAAETDTTKRLAPDGAGGVAWATPIATLTDHGALTGLLDDDHTQYVLRSILTTNGDLFTRVAGAVARLGATAPAANVRNVLGLDNGDTIPAWKTALDATAPTTIAVSDVAAPGTSLVFAHRDHVHGAPATWVSTPHNLLDGTVNQDTLAGSPTRGDIVYANSTSKWARLAKGAAGSLLAGDGTDTAWVTNVKIAGYLTVGSTSAPANTTAGDVTTIRLLVGTDATFATYEDSIFAVTYTGASGISVHREKATFTPSGLNTTGVGSQLRMAVQPSAADSGNFYGVAFTAVHDSGAFNLTGQLVAMLATHGQQVGSSTVTNLYGFLSSSTSNAGTTTRQSAFQSQFNTGGSATITTFNHYDIVMNVSTGTITTHRGLNVPNLGGAAFTTSVAIDIATQSGSVTSNFGIRNVSNYLGTGYMRLGAVTAPTNVTDGDLTALRFFLTNTAAVNASVVTLATGTVTPAATNFGIYISRVFTPNGGNVGTAELLRAETYVRPSAADSGGFLGFEVLITHDSGAFNLTGALTGLLATGKQSTGSTSVTNLIPFNAQSVVSAGDVVTLENIRSQMILTGGGAITTATFIGLLASSFPTSIGTYRGISIPNIGNAVVTTAVAIEIAVQTGATNNFGIRNVSNYVGTGYMRLGGVTAPTNVASGDLTTSGVTVLSPTAAANITAVSATIPITSTIVTITADASYTLTSAPTIADGTSGQILIIMNVDTADTITFQDQGTLASSNLRLAANQVALAPRQSIILVYNSTVGDWVQVSAVAGVL